VIIKKIKGIVKGKGRFLYIYVPKMKTTIPLPCCQQKGLTKYKDVASERQMEYIEWLKKLQCNDRVTISIESYKKNGKAIE